MTNQTTRVLELLKRFNDGQTVCIDALATQDLFYGKSEKTIRRDLDAIKESFPVECQSESETGTVQKSVSN